MIRVGFVMAYADQGWMGGINYLSNLLHSVMLLKERRIEPVLIVPADVPENILAGFPQLEIISTNMVDFSSGHRKLRKGLAKILSRDVLLERFLKINNIDILSHSDHLGACGKVPTICWIPDFQHRRLPEFFQQKELASRDKGYDEIAKNCSTLILSSCDAQSDLKNFAPNFMSKSRVLNFVSGFKSNVASTGIEVLQVKYGIKTPYFHLPNQFWVHKNHGVVIKALKILKARGVNALVLSTGHTKDHRQPEYFEKLMAQVNDAGLQDNFKALGIVPYEDLSGLMRNAVAVLNPSFFEGWSTTVEESKSLGKTVILSDIPVHREQAPEFGVYFNPKDEIQLADSIESVLGLWSPNADAPRSVQAEAALHARFADFGRRYQEIALETYAAHA